MPFKYYNKGDTEYFLKKPENIGEFKKMYFDKFQGGLP